MKRIFAPLFAFALLSACATAQPADVAAAPAPVATPAPVTAGAGTLLDDTPRIAIATAYAPEFAALIPSLEGAQEYVVNGRPFYTGTLAGKPVILFETGVSIVNAAMNTQLLFDHFDVASIVVSGIAGGVDPSLSIGDVTVPAKWGQYNEMIFMRPKPGGGFMDYPWESGEKFKPFLFMRPNGVDIVSAEDPDPEKRFWFYADPRLLEIAREVAPDVKFELCASDGMCLHHMPKLVIGGNGVTGSVFQDYAPFREYLFDEFQAQVTEMETAAVAMVSHANDVPFIAFRSLSDLAGGGSAEANEEEVFMNVASENAAAVVEAFLRKYPEDMLE